MEQVPWLRVELQFTRAAATPSEARHHARKVAVVAVVKPITPGANVAGTGSYNEALTTADYAYEPQLGYSNALFFQVWPRYSRY